MPKKLSMDEVEERARNLNPNLTLDRETYKDTGTSCRWVDSIDGEFWRIPSHIFEGLCFHSSSSRKRAAETCMKNHGVSSPFNIPESREKMKKAMIKNHGAEYYAQSSEGKKALQDWHTEESCEIRKKTNMEKYGCEYVAGNKDVRQKIYNTWKEKYISGHPWSDPAVREKINQTIFDKYGVENIGASKEHRKKMKKTMILKYGVDNPSKCPEIKKKMFAKKPISKPEKFIQELLTNRGIPFVYEMDINGKFWDFVILDSKGEPDLVIEIDGEFCHGLLNDHYSSHTRYQDDAGRASLLPKGVKFLVTDSLNVKKCVPEIMRLIGIDYQVQIDEIFNQLADTKFPFPEYTEKRMKSDFEKLCRSDTKKFDPYSSPANSVMTHFHKSIYTSRWGHKTSPSEAWLDPTLLKKCIENRYIYKSNLSSQTIARGFEKNHIAPRVTVFAPSLARFLLSTYAPEAKTAIDPFSGFSGRMLGSASLGMQYTGSDIRQEAVDESNSIIDFLGLIGCSVFCGNAETVDLPQSDVLITCPPYGNKEIWGNPDGDYLSADNYVEMCLCRFEANTYIFVVDATEKFKNSVMYEIPRKGYLKHSSAELVLVFRKIH